jgi:hypothetical protein
MKNRIIILILISLGINQTVELISSEPMFVNGINTMLYTFGIESQDIEMRQVFVNSYHQDNSNGAVVLNTGGMGTSFYSSYGQNGINTITTLYNAGYEIYELRWLGSHGWATNSRGFGYHNAVGAYSELIEYLHANYFDNPGRVFANGNSGGAVQIAYGLAKYSLEEIMTMVILSGGPPTSDLRNGIFCDGTNPICWPDDLEGFIFTDYLMGWNGNGDYCYYREAPEYIKVQLDPVSLVTDLDNRDYHYSTFVNFVQSDDETNADHQAELYYNEITSEKDWHFLSSIIEHAVPATYLGAQKIQELIINFQESIIGDTNSDGIIDILDISLIVNYILGFESEIQNADMNNDGLVNITDIVILINLILVIE